MLKSIDDCRAMKRDMIDRLLTVVLGLPMEHQGKLLEFISKEISSLGVRNE